MKIPRINTKINTQAEANQFAMDWQKWQSTQWLTYSELIEWQDVFEKLAERFDLKEEFKENGII